MYIIIYVLYIYIYVCFSLCCCLWIFSCTTMDTAALQAMFLPTSNAGCRSRCNCWHGPRSNIYALEIIAPSVWETKPKFACFIIMDQIGSVFGGIFAWLLYCWTFLGLRTPLFNSIQCGNTCNTVKKHQAAAHPTTLWIGATKLERRCNTGIIRVNSWNSSKKLSYFDFDSHNFKSNIFCYMCIYIYPIYIYIDTYIPYVYK